MVPERLPPRVGADLCVRPRIDPAKNHIRADTSVGPYKTFVNPKNRAGTEPRPYRNTGSLPHRAVGDAGPYETFL